MQDLEYLLKTATLAAKKAGQLFKRNFGRPKQISIKGHNIRDSVTSIDVAIEKQLRSTLSKALPSAKIIGEELGSADVLKNDWVWIIDPIDGTNNFISGIQLCCISIALWHNSEPVVGIVYNPITEQLFSAAKGKGAFLNGKRISVSQVKTVALG